MTPIIDKSFETKMSELVLDRNVVRRSEFSRYKSDPDARFVLTDTFFVEAVKNSDAWQETLRRDFEALSLIRARIRMACSVSEALRMESTQSRAITREEWFPSDIQALLDRLIDTAAQSGESFARELDNIRKILPDLQVEQPDAVESKARTEFVVGELRRHLSKKDLSSLRSDRMPKDVKLGLVNYIARAAYTADCLSKSKIWLPWPGSATARFFILRVWRGVWWIQKGGLEQAREHLLQNDGYDDEYVIVGSFVDGVISIEKRVMEASADLTRLIAPGDANAVTAAFDDYMAQSDVEAEGRV